MRYIAKIYVSDVLDQVVVSGYVHDCPPPGSDAPEMFEFTVQEPGTGEPEPLRWLARALEGVTERVLQEGLRTWNGSPTGGGQHTISGITDRP